MLKNIFIESCILSLLVFGGFYVNAHFLKKQIDTSDEKMIRAIPLPHEGIRPGNDRAAYLAPVPLDSQHISGMTSDLPKPLVLNQHISGRNTPVNPQEKYPEFPRNSPGIGGIPPAPGPR